MSREGTGRAAKIGAMAAGGHQTGAIAGHFANRRDRAAIPAADRLARLLGRRGRAERNGVSFPGTVAHVRAVVASTAVDRGVRADTPVAVIVGRAMVTERKVATAAGARRKN